jgi:hypothetical protein
MKSLLGSWMLLSLTSLLQGGSQPPESEVKYGFATKDYSIELRVNSFDSYLGRRLAFLSSVDPGKEVCFSADAGGGPCVEHFVGAVAVVRYSVRLANGAAPRFASIREYVTVSAQSSELPERAPFSMTQKLVNGIGSDIQAFGYDEAPLKRVDRTRTRKLAQAMPWRLCKQELYLNEEPKPFAIVIWKHTLNRISIDHIYAPPDGE